MSAALRISAAISGGREWRCVSAAIASAAPPPPVPPVPLTPRRFLAWRCGASRSCHSGAPSSLVHCACGFGRGAPRRRSRSSESSQLRSSPSRRLTWWAPRRATLPHPAALRGRRGRSSGGADVPPDAPVPVPVRVRGGPDRAAPVLGAPLLAEPVRWAPGRAELERACPDLGPSVRVPAGLGRRVWPALLRPLVAPPPPEPAPDPPRLGAPLRVPAPLVGRRAPPLAPPVPALREEGRPVPLRLPCPPPPGLAGRADPPDRAEEARRFGCEEFCGIR